ncbi:MAG: molecular chaperone GrpE [Bacteroidales bacterium]|jgi:molecular chaperone GrpE|nr:molecular chaperone GrpE [Bacteroidales bacterium]
MGKKTQKETKENKKDMQQAQQQEIKSEQKGKTKSEKNTQKEHKEKVKDNVEQEDKKVTTKKEQDKVKTEEQDKKVTTEEQESSKNKKSEQEKIEELNDKYLRLAAEYDNYRRRTLKEKMELAKSAGEDILINILPVMDDFERGLASIDKAKEVDAIKEGVLLIYNKFKEFLKQRGVKEIEAKEKEFDTDLHEAVTKIPAPSEELKGKVVDVIEKGYLLNDKVIRYAKVVIGE